MGVMSFAPINPFSAVGSITPPSPSSYTHTHPLPYLCNHLTLSQALWGHHRWCWGHCWISLCVDRAPGAPVMLPWAVSGDVSWEGCIKQAYVRQLRSGRRRRPQWSRCWGWRSLWILFLPWHALHHLDLQNLLCIIHPGQGDTRFPPPPQILPFNAFPKAAAENIGILPASLARGMHHADVSGACQKKYLHCNSRTGYQCDVPGGR